jgi:hypothetical protein
LTSFAQEQEDNTDQGQQASNRRDEWHRPDWFLFRCETAQTGLIYQILAVRLFINHAIIRDMRKQTERTIALTDITINAIEGGFAGALMGALVSVSLAVLIWCVQVGLLGGLPVGRDIVYSLTTGAVYGAFIGAAWALADYWTHRLPPQ